MHQQRKPLFNTVLLILLTLLIVTTAACSSNNNNAATNTKEDASVTNNGGNTANTEAPADAEPVKEPITLKVWPVTFAQNFPSGIQEDPVAKAIDSQLQIKIDVESHPTDEKFQALMASGDLPDVIIPEGTTKYVNQLIEGDNLIDLEPLLQEHGPDIMKNAAKAIEYAKQYQSNGTGKLYFIPAGILPEAEARLQNIAIIGPFLRWDYYEEIGAPELKGYDDVLNAVAAMLKKHPTNEDGQKYFGFSQWFDWDIWGIAMYPSWMEGKDYSANGLYQVDHETLEFESMLTAERSSIWLGVDFWNKAYKMGLLDPDALTQKYDTAIQKGSSNRVLAAISSWQLSGSNALLAKAGYPDRGYTSVPVPVTGAKNIFTSLTPFGGGRMWAVTKNSKSPERAVELINYFYSVDGVQTLYNGIKDVDWTEQDGKKQQTDTAVAALQTDPNYVLTSGAGKYTNNVGLAPGFVNPDTGETVLINNRELQIKNMTALDKAMTGFYGVEHPRDILPAGYGSIVNKNTIVNSFLAIAPDDIKRIDDKILNYAISALSKMILIKDEKTYAAQKEKIIADIQAMDYEKSLTWHKEAFEQARTDAAPYLN